MQPTFSGVTTHGLHDPPILPRLSGIQTVDRSVAGEGRLRVLS
ncbi:hypothetical protein HNQ04_000778 [Deinococcus radiopugnans ATCC 19172]|uniref:Uncharacterized protein n=1 Tax=Deinococcus radiopugnans ATCC 19172 TaxID=585398 RepID=A0ABR6NQ17_9DEIO|nr:hypothetical protein [Deinococcus radiopugnans ATCC 19172]